MSAVSVKNTTFLTLKTSSLNIFHCSSNITTGKAGTEKESNRPGVMNWRPPRPGERI